ncbi:MAG: hypothetical protein EA370_07405 [Wenzhouxiangella sp.]|nr:MAG: hypothetical protein EA370_07405 [Wenzhouxiangella sp.]
MIAGGVSIWLSGWALSLKIISSGLTLVYGLFAVDRLLRPRWSALIIHSNSLKGINRAGIEHRILTSGSSFLSPWFLATGSGPSRLGLFRGQVETDDFRRLTVFLRQTARSSLVR